MSLLLILLLTLLLLLLLLIKLSDVYHYSLHEELHLLMFTIVSSMMQMCYRAVRRPGCFLSSFLYQTSYLF